MSQYYEQHAELLNQARAAIKSRKDWAAFAEAPSEKVYGEGSKQRGEDAFKAHLGQRFTFKQPFEGASWAVGETRSPYGIDMNIEYPKVPLDALLERAQNAHVQWRKLPAETRLGLCIEMLHRLAKESFQMAHAVMHTSGQPFVMSFQAGGPHALDRGLEVVAYAAEAMQANDLSVDWAKVVGKSKEGEPINVAMDKTYIPRGKGIGVVIGCATFPTWNTYPAVFGDLATGNSVIIKPSQQAILPLAIAVDVMRDVLAEAGIDPNVVQLAACGDRSETQKLVQDARVKMIDYTGGPTFGRWMEENTAGKQLYLEQAGINTILIESTDNYKGMLNNIAFSLSLYSGQMCTAPQNVYIVDKVKSEQGEHDWQSVARDISAAVAKLLGDDQRAFSLLGALNSEGVKKRVAHFAADARNVGEAGSAHYDAFPDADNAKPLLLAIDGDRTDAQEEQFGPIDFALRCADKQTALQQVCQSIEQYGAMTTSLYSVDDGFKQQAIEAIADAGSPLSVNLTGGVYVNQSAAYSDFHGSGLNPAANCSISDLGFVARRFGWVTVREQRHG